MKTALISAALAAWLWAAPAFADAAGDANAKAFEESLKPRSGFVAVPGASASFNISTKYKFLTASDARKVLEEAWGNPPDETVLGMIIPADRSVLGDKAWAAVVTFEEMGYVKDEDAADIKPAELLKTMQSDVEAANAARKADGYQPVHLLGWAQQPVYDAKAHKLSWGKQLQFDGQDGQTLNFDQRILGRHGVLVISFIASMDQVAEVKAASPEVLAMGNFDAGRRYEDFIPGKDTVAAVGVGGLIAGKVLAKTGLLAALLIFLKKGAVFLVIGIGAAWRWFKSKFSRTASQA
jgi:uncharacterized membrane-anchored protein